MKRNRKKKGFTLIELIVVIAILGVLAAIAVPRLSGVGKNAKIAADNASIRTIMSAVSTAEAEDKINLSTKPNAATIKNVIVPTYLNEIPKSQTGSGWNVSYDENGSLVIEAIGTGDPGSTFQDKPAE